jgi:hypothetical protein
MPQPVKLFCVSCLNHTQHMPGGNPLAMNCGCGQIFVDQSKNTIHRNLEAIVMVAKHEAKEHNCNYNIILMNPVEGELGESSTYEMVADSYFEKERPNVKLIATTLQLGVIVYDEWLKYTEYEKAECDIKLHDGTIIYHCYPNAGKFNPMCADSIQEIPEDQVKEIMYRKYYLEGLCKSNKYNCNKIEGNDKEARNQLGDPGEQFAHYDHEVNKIIDHFSNTRHYSDGGRAMKADMTRRFVSVRTEPKIGRNEPCTCGSGKKYKKCCM